MSKGEIERHFINLDEAKQEERERISKIVIKEINACKELMKVDKKFEYVKKVLEQINKKIIGGIE